MKTVLLTLYWLWRGGEAQWSGLTFPIIVPNRFRYVVVVVTDGNLRSMTLTGRPFAMPGGCLWKTCVSQVLDHSVNLCYTKLMRQSKCFIRAGACVRNDVRVPASGPY